MATYPAAVYSPRTKNNKSGVVYDPDEDTTLYAEDVVNDDNEIVAIETELGTNPKGAKASVKARLDDVDTAIGTKISKTIAGELSAMTPKSALVDNDIFLIEDSEVSNAKKKTLFSSIKSVLKTYFDSLYLALSGGTLTGDIVFGENTGLKLDTALSADGKYCGIVEDGEAGEALAFGQLCIAYADDGTWYKADANEEDLSIEKLGICVLAASGDGESTKILLYGKVRADSLYPTLGEGTPVYMSETPGSITQTRPSTADVCIRKIGFGNFNNELFFNPSNDYIIHV